MNTNQFPPPPSPAPRRLERTDGRVAGVAGGLGDYLSVDPTVVRVGMIVATLVAFPWMPLGYLAAWAVMPERAPVMPPPPYAPPPPAAPSQPEAAQSNATQPNAVQADAVQTEPVEVEAIESETQDEEAADATTEMPA